MGLPRVRGDRSHISAKALANQLVFPACAGIVQSAKCKDTVKDSPPRLSGDRSASREARGLDPWISPR